MGKKMLFTSGMIIVSVLFVGGNETFAASSASKTYAKRAIWDVTAQSITIRTQPSPSAPQRGPIQSMGCDEVKTNINDLLGTTSGGYTYYQMDYVDPSVGKYSDTYSGYGAITGPNGEMYTDSVWYATNTTTSSDSIWQYSDFSGTKLGSLAVSQKTGGGSTGMTAANDNPAAWLVYVPGTTTYGYVNGWFVNGSRY